LYSDKKSEKKKIKPETDIGIIDNKSVIIDEFWKEFKFMKK